MCDGKVKNIITLLIVAHGVVRLDRMCIARAARIALLCVGSITLDSL